MPDGQTDRQTALFVSTIVSTVLITDRPFHLPLGTLLRRLPPFPTDAIITNDEANGQVLLQLLLLMLATMMRMRTET